MASSTGDDDGPPQGRAPAVFQPGQPFPADRGTGSRLSIPAPVPSLPPEALPRSEPPANEVLRETLVRDFHEKLEALQQLYAVLGKANHYALLGIASTASPKEVRRAYAACSKRFHLDAFFRQHVGDHRDQLEAVFSALTAAYEVLRRPRTRAEYDESIGLAQHERWTALLAEAGRPSMPPAPSSPHLDVIAPPSPGTASEARASMPNTAPTVASGSFSARPAPTTNPSMRPPPAITRSLRAPAASQRPASASDARGMAPRERAASAARAEREAFSTEETAPVRVRPSGSPGTGNSVRPSFAPEYTARIRATLPPASTLTLLEMSQHLRTHGGGGLSVWAAQRLREAHEEEQAGRPAEAVAILRKLLTQVRDPAVEAHVRRLEKLAGR